MRRRRSSCSTATDGSSAKSADKVYGLGYGHSIRYDRYDNLWIVDKGTDAVIKFDPSGKVVMNLGRRPEGFDSGHIEHAKQADARAVDGWFGSPTDVTWDQDDNIYVSDGYVNSRIAKFNKNGDWITVLGQVRQGRQERRRKSRTASTIRTTCRPTGTATSTSPIAATAAFRCSIATATSSASCS